jgi:DNA-binding Lrp family transcriptional regulator
MSSAQLDEIDHGILFALQRDARNTTIAEIAEEVDVSASTVRNRIDRLEENGIIEGYYPKIDYERANFPLHVLFVCNAPANEREELAATALESRGVIDVREMLTSTRNLYVEVVATDTRDLTVITNELTGMNLEVVSSEIITSHRVKPWGEFEYESTSSGTQT